MFVGRVELSPTCRIVLFPIFLYNNSQTGLYIFCDCTLLSSEFLGEFLWRQLLAKITPVLMVLDLVHSSTAPDHLELKIQTHMQLTAQRYEFRGGTKLMIYLAKNLQPLPHPLLLS